MVLKRTVLGGIKPVVLWFSKKTVSSHTDVVGEAICPCCGSLGRYSLFVDCCLDSDDVEALVDGQLELVKC